MARRDYYEGGNSPTAKEAGSNANKKRGGGLSFDGGKKPKKASGGSVGSDKSPFSSAGGGKASTSPFSSACRK